MSPGRRCAGAFAVLALFASELVCAHRPSDAFVELDVTRERIEGHWQIALRDLALLIELDSDADGALDWGELRAAQAGLSSMLTQALELEADGETCPLNVDDLLVNDRGDGRYAWFVLSAQCPQPPEHLRLDYRLLFDLDPTHRGILVLRAGGATHTAVFAPDATVAGFDLDLPSPWRAFRDYLREGVWHIWIGLDHALFLLALLLPAVLVYENQQWRGATRPRSVLIEVLAVVTAFTVAHSITLSLAVFGWLRVPGTLVEALIALSVLLAALNNLRPVVLRWRWAAAFGFGLVHGFGFAPVLVEPGLPQALRALALFAFNLGVELGQIAIVALAVPLAYLARDTRFYRGPLRVAGSLVVAALASLWLLQRTLPG